tara:strand:- start:678 stop:986 length:309 start_codon:yes stop_codon:yes gene_type:complete
MVKHLDGHRLNHTQLIQEIKASHTVAVEVEFQNFQCQKDHDSVHLLTTCMVHTNRCQGCQSMTHDRDLIIGNSPFGVGAEDLVKNKIQKNKKTPPLKVGFFV